MKFPSLDTAEGIVVLTIGAFVAYTVYKAYQVGAGAPAAIKKTLTDASDGLSNIISDVIPNSSVNAADAMLASDPLSKENVANALQQRTIDFGSGGNTWDSGLGTDTTTNSAPQNFSPSAAVPSDGYDGVHL